MYCERLKQALIISCCGAFLVALSSLSFAQADRKFSVKISGFTQATSILGEDNGAFKFGFDRVRIVAKGGLNQYVDYKLQVDFMKATAGIDKDGDTPAIIKDAEITFRAGKKLRFSVGKFKTPIGMEFNNSGKKLDFVKRGFGHQTFVFERNAGAMIHAKGLGEAGFGFAFGVFNAGPKNATNVGNAKDGDYTLVGRVSLDPSKAFHVEGYWGSATTSIDTQKAVTVFGLGAIAKVQKFVFKGEFMKRNDAQNAKADGTTFYVQGGLRISPRVQPVIKYEKLDVTNDKRDRTDITLGVNFFLNPKNVHQSKIMLNYIISDAKGKDALQVMYQASF